MYQSPLHSTQGSETLPASSARRRGMMLLARRVNNNFLLALLNARARLRCGDFANVDMPQVRPPTPGALACQPHLSTGRYRPPSRDSHRGQHPRLCSHNEPPFAVAYAKRMHSAPVQALSSTPGANVCLPFVRQFYSDPSRFVWHDADGQAHLISQAEGGAQGDPLMPALFALGQHAALAEARRQLRPDECLLAYLDDIYVITSPERTRVVFDLLSLHLHRRAHIQLHRGKTRVCKSGLEPPGIRELGSVTDPVWVGDRGLPSDQQGLVALGVPCGHPAFVAAQLQLTRAKQDQLLQGIRTLPDLQSAWLLLLFCASPRCTHVLRALPPVASLAFAESHDAAIAACVVDLLGTGPLPDSALQIAQLPFQQGGLNLRSGVALAPAAYRASWADTLPVLHRQLPTLAGEILARLRAREPAGPALSGVLQAQDALTTAGFRPPSWEDLLDNPAPPSFLDLSGRGWQAPAATAIAEQLQAALLPQLDAASQALLFSQTGPFSSRPFCSVPSCPELTFPSDHLRALLLRRLRLPLPLSARSCRCRRPLDPLGDHRAACARSGALRSRGCPLERAAARVCREAGARVTCNTLVRDLNVAVARFDDRRIEVIANGLPLWNGAQLAVDTTIVSPLTANGVARSLRDPARPIALQEARRRKEATYPELVGNARCRLVVLGAEVGGPLEC